MMVLCNGVLTGFVTLYARALYGVTRERNPHTCFFDYRIRSNEYDIRYRHIVYQRSLLYTINSVFLKDGNVRD
jgi:hypothetical protein